MSSTIIAAVVLCIIFPIQLCNASKPNEVNYVKSDDIQHYPCPSGSTVKCKTLAEYLTNQNMYLNNNQVFVFLCGTHNLTGVLEVRDRHNIFLNGSTRCEVNGEDTSVIQCNRKVPSGITFANSSNVHIHNIKMVDCWAPIGSALSTLHYAGLSFHRVTGVHINNMAVVNSRQFGINAYSCQGELIIKDSHFHGNGDHVFYGGNARFLYEDCSDKINTLEIKSSNFSEGRTSLGDSTATGIMITALCSELKVTFEAIAANNNSGGNIMIRMNYITFQKWSVAVHESLIANGSGSTLGSGFVLLSSFPAGSPDYNHCHDKYGTLKVVNTKFTGNKEEMFGASLHIVLQESICKLVGIEIHECLFDSNSTGYGTALKINLPVFPKHLQLASHEIVLSTTLFSNILQQHEMSSTMELINIENVHLVNCTFTNNLGTAVSLQNSNLILTGDITFKENRGVYGAAMAFYGSSSMFINNHTSVCFQNNRASKMGGAIYIKESDFDTPKPCFFQPNVRSHTLIFQLHDFMKLEFINNTAELAGNAIYGGEVYRCTMFRKFVDTANISNETKNIIPSLIFNAIFNFTDKLLIIPSKPDHVLSFQQERIHICTDHMKRSAFPGQIFNISVQARSQCNGTAIPTLIDASLSDKSSVYAQIIMEKEIFIYNSLNVCTIFSVKFKLNSDNFGKSSLTIEVVLSHKNYADANISIDLQSCPWGFQLNNGTCECANYNSVQSKGNLKCDFTSGRIQKHDSSYWIGCYRKGSESCRNKEILWTSTTHRDCCHYVTDMLVTAEDIDIQCKEGRTGLGCGSCLGNYSVVLGTDNCMKCSDSYLGLVPLYMLAVILLIFFLTAFNVTITNGYLNCFIFYANFIYINRNEFFSAFSKYEVTRLMITWLNLDLGIEVCLFNGMTMIQKTWLQLGYVFYMLTLHIIIIFLCRRSTRCTRLFGENVHKVLSTLILLSFVKTGRIVLSTCSVKHLFIFSSRFDVNWKVWLVDPNIGYAEGKHIPLLIVAVFLLVVLLLLTLSLLFIQFLARLSGWRCFRWVTKLYPFFETFTGPCTPNYAFWQGLMFAFQILMLLTHLLKLSLVSTTGLLALILAILSCALPNGVYKRRSVNFFQFSLLVNIVLLCSVHNFNNIWKRATQISISIAFLSLFIFLLVDNSKKIKERLVILRRWCCMCIVVNDQRLDQLQQQRCHVTHTEVTVSPEGSNEHTPLVPAQSLPPVVHFDTPKEALMQTGGN